MPRFLPLLAGELLTPSEVAEGRLSGLCSEVQAKWENLSVSKGVEIELIVYELEANRSD